GPGLHVVLHQLRRHILARAVHPQAARRDRGSRTRALPQHRRSTLDQRSRPGALLRSTDPVAVPVQLPAGPGARRCPVLADGEAGGWSRDLSHLRVHRGGEKAFAGEPAGRFAGSAGGPGTADPAPAIGPAPEGTAQTPHRRRWFFPPALLRVLAVT